MGLTLLERGSGDVYVHLLPLSVDLYALVVGEWDNFVPMNPEPPAQDVVRRAATTNDVDLFTVRIGPTISSWLMWPRVNQGVPSKPETLMGCFTILSRVSHAASRTDKAIMFNGDLMSTIARLSLTPLMQDGIYKGRLCWLGKPRAWV